MASIMIMDECVQLCDHGGMVSAKGGDEYTPARQIKECRDLIKIQDTGRGRSELKGGDMQWNRKH